MWEILMDNYEKLFVYNYEKIWMDKCGKNREKLFYPTIPHLFNKFNYFLNLLIIFEDPHTTPINPF